MIKSIKYGTNLINDVSGFEFDKNSIPIIKKVKYFKSITPYEGYTYKQCKIIRIIKMFY